MTRMEVYPIFPTPLGVVELDRDFTKKELSFIKSLEMEKNTGNFISVNDYVLEEKELSKLKDFCLTSINYYFKSIYDPVLDVSLKITQSWTNLTQKDGHHHKHHHINSAYSATLYIETVDDDRIYFETPNGQMLQVKSKEYTNLNSNSWWMPATKGSLIMWPSWLDHHVVDKGHEGDRISLSFNTFFVGEIGNRKDRSHLVVE